MATEEQPITVIVCGPSRQPCKCACPDGPCDHRWDGKGKESDGGRRWSVTCSRCGASAMGHDMWVGP